MTTGSGKFRKIKKVLYFLFLYPFCKIIAWFWVNGLLIFKNRFRILVCYARTDRIGELVPQIKSFYNDKDRPLTLWHFDKPYCNEFLVQKIKKQTGIVKNILPKVIFDCIYKYKNKKKFAFLFYEKNFRINKNLKQKTPNFLKLTKGEIFQGEKILKKFGVVPTDKVCCLMVRDDKYLSEKESLHAEKNHRHRNASPQSYIKAIKFLCKNKIFVFRMGKNQKEKIIFHHPYFIDYAFKKWRSDFLDVFLSWRCDCCISTSTGWDELVQAYGKPIIYTNFYPLAYLPTYAKKSLIIFKKIAHCKKNKKLSIRSLKKHKLFFGLDPSNKGHKYFRICDNTSKEILEATKEGLFQKIKITKTKKQKMFWRCFPKGIRDFNNSYRLHAGIHARIGDKFLERNKFLLS